MNTEYQSEYQPEPQPAPVFAPAGFTSFWPLLILIVGLILWSGYQAQSAYAQSSMLGAEFKQVQPTITQAQNVQSRLYAVAQDLIQTGSKDPYAAQIVKEADIRYRPGQTANGH